MEFRSVADVPEWTEDLRSRTIEYWQSRKFRFDTTMGDDLLAERGSLWGNMTSFDMTELVGTLWIGIRDNVMECTMRVNPAYQIITKGERASLQREVDDFGPWLTEHLAMEDRFGCLPKMSREELWRFLASDEKSNLDPDG